MVSKKLIIQIINMKKYLLIFSLILLGQSCSGWKKEMTQKGNIENAIKNAILDFCHTSNLAKKDKTFYIYFKDYETKAIGVSITGNINKIYVLHGSPQSRVPDQYIEYDNKLFYWYDNKTGKSLDIVKKLSEYKVIDSIKVSTEDMGNIRDDAKKGANYYFCRDNLLVYKKEETPTAMPREIKIDLNCKQ